MNTLKPKDKADLLKALKMSRGIVSTACDACDISRGTYYNWMEADPKFKAEVDSINERTIDFVESKLFELIDGPFKEVMTDEGPIQIKDQPNTAATIFYLKTKAKHRGYVERQEITGADGGPVIVAPDNV